MELLAYRLGTLSPGRVLNYLSPMLNSFPLMRASSLCMQYSTGSARVDALKNVDLEIAAGERVAVTGPSGCGKTTLLLLLAGLERPTGGSIHVEGKPLSEMGPDALADFRRDRIGIVFQSFHLVPSLAALENVALPLEIAGARDARVRAKAMLEKVGLSERGQHYPSQLSGGEQQRVAIARAFATRPDILFADEPTGNLDSETGASIVDQLFGLNAQQHTTLILITHDSQLASRCSRRLQLRQGQLLEAQQ